MSALPPKADIWQKARLLGGAAMLSIVAVRPQELWRANPIVDLCLTDLPTRTLAVKSSAFSCVIGFLLPARCNAILFLKCATVISNAGSTRQQLDHRRFAKPLPLSTHDNGIRCRLGDQSGPRSVERGRCPLWVKSGHVQCKRACPLYPRKRTCAMQLRMSAKGQEQTHAAQQNVPIRSPRRRFVGDATAR